MGYRIQYGIVTTKDSLKEKVGHKKNATLYLALGTIAVLMTVTYLRHKSLEPILYPGDPSVTKSAVSDMIRSIEGGEMVAEAFSDFCFRILQG